MTVESPARVWLSGASEGIGLAAALAFARAGAHVAICARRPGPLATAARALEAAGAASVAQVSADVASPAGVDAFADAALAALGGVDILVHAAGGGGPAPTLASDDATFESDWAYAFGVNLMGAARLARRAAPHLPDGRGAIALVSSAFGFQAMDITAPSYGATKAGLHHLTVTLARELAPRHPRRRHRLGPVWTEHRERDLQRDAAESGRDPEGLRAEPTPRWAPSTPLAAPHRRGRPRHQAGLTSPDASFITGTTVAVDGGYVRAPAESPFSSRPRPRW
ncbi:MAG: SDR family oxidoreductase [Myxococcota bacterium]